MFRITLKLAWKTMRENGRVYLPYILGTSAMTALLFSIGLLKDYYQTGQSFGVTTMGTLLLMGEGILSLFALFFFFYINGFLMKTRSEEYGLFAILGMEKKHLLMILFFQSAICWAFSLILGTLAGFLFSKVMLLLSEQLLTNSVPLGFTFSIEPLISTFVIISALFLLVFLYTAWFVLKNDPLELKNAAQTAETEPKSQPLLTILGLASLGAGYYMAMTTTAPINAMMLFFVAVALVILGTYLLFVSGSISLLKILQKNRRYYYQTNHFLTVSTMKYRMKQNAVSLASISILSTMILVALSTTVSLYAGIVPTVEKSYPTQISYAMMYSDETDAQDIARAGTEMEAIVAQYQPYNESLVITKRFVDQDQGIFPDDVFIDAFCRDELKDHQNEIPMLGPDQAVYFGTDADKLRDQIVTFGSSPFQIVQAEETIPDYLKPLISNTNGGVGVLIVTDLDALQTLPDYWIVKGGFDSDHFVHGSIADSEDENKLIEAITERIGENLYTNVIAQSMQMKDYYSLYGGLFMVGIFCSVAILVILILIMYYKQVSEGYADRNRFKILTNVGLEKKQIRRLINSQTMVMFFLPLGVSSLHLLFGFTMLSRFLNVLVMDNPMLFIITCLICLGIFALIYLLIYKLTSRVYYNIVAL